MLPTATTYAALYLPNTRGTDAKKCLAAATRVLAAHDPRPDGPPVQVPHRYAAHGARFGVRAVIELQSEMGPRILIEVWDRDGAQSEAPAALLSAIVLHALRDCPADMIEWGAPGAFIERDDFIALRTYASPRRAPIDQDAGVYTLSASDLVREPSGPDALRATRGPLNALALSAAEWRLKAAGIAAAIALPAALVSQAVDVVRGA